MRHGALIQRVRTDPLGTDYLSLDGAVPQWSEHRSDAVFFASYDEAEARAAALGGRPIFAVVAQKPQRLVAVLKRTLARNEDRRRRDQAPARDKHPVLYI
jgi:hypothetical protein